MIAGPFTNIFIKANLAPCCTCSIRYIKKIVLVTLFADEFMVFIVSRGANVGSAVRDFLQALPPVAIFIGRPQITCRIAGLGVEL